MIGNLNHSVDATIAIACHRKESSKREGREWASAGARARADGRAAGTAEEFGKNNDTLSPRPKMPVYFWKKM